jgi:hypothetical protein
MGAAMPENYRQLADPAEMLPDSALIRMWREGGHIRAALVLDAEDAPPTDPDLALFQASLALAQLDLRCLFVWLEDSAIWQDEWGILHAP